MARFFVTIALVIMNGHGVSSHRRDFNVHSDTSMSTPLSLYFTHGILASFVLVFRPTGDIYPSIITFNYSDVLECHHIGCYKNANNEFNGRHAGIAFDGKKNGSMTCIEFCMRNG